MAVVDHHGKAVCKVVASGQRINGASVDHGVRPVSLRVDARVAVGCCDADAQGVRVRQIDVAVADLADCGHGRRRLVIAF